MAKNPELLQKDTVEVKIHDTIIRPEITHDTLTQFFYNDTTIIKYQNDLTLKLYLDSITNNLYAEATQPRDTVFIEKTIQVPFEKVVVQELTLWEKHRGWAIPVFFILLALIIIKRALK